MAGGLEGQLYDALVLVRRSQVEDREDVLPAWADVRRLGVNHLGYTAHHHVSDGGRPGQEIVGKKSGLEGQKKKSWGRGVDKKVGRHKSQSNEKKETHLFIDVNYL